MLSKKNKTKKKIYLVRHAETFANTGEKLEHPAHIRLTEKGISQAKELAKKIKKPGKIVVSKYFRTLQTATPLIEKHENVEVLVLPHIHEFTYLSPVKLLDKDVSKEKKDTMVKSYWEQMDPKYSDGDIAESFANLVKRVEKSIKQIKNIKAEGDIFIFTHGMFIKTFMLLNEKKNLKPKQLMQEFYNLQFVEKAEIKNCEILDVTDIIAKSK